MAQQQLIKTPDSAANHCLLVTGERQRAVCHSDCGNAAHSSPLGFPDSMMSHYLVSFTSSGPKTATGEKLAGPGRKYQYQHWYCQTVPGSRPRHHGVFMSTWHSEADSTSTKTPGIFRGRRAWGFKAVNFALNNASLSRTENFQFSCIILQFQLDFYICSVYPAITPQ